MWSTSVRGIADVCWGWSWMYQKLAGWNGIQDLSFFEKMLNGTISKQHMWLVVFRSNLKKLQDQKGTIWVGRSHHVKLLPFKVKQKMVPEPITTSVSRFHVPYFFLVVSAVKASPHPFFNDWWSMRSQFQEVQRYPMGPRLCPNYHSMSNSK